MKKDEDWTMEFINEPPEEQLDFIRYLALSKEARVAFEKSIDKSSENK
ncbi:hypothetical protein [Bacillus sp. E(2018)]|nr:hypothetical protein [Bacillus sp. E(2018)]